MSNVLGTENPVAALVALAHQHGAKVLVDGAQAVMHHPVDVQALDCDFYAFSAHKLYGPTGIGMLYVKQDILQDMAPWEGGGSMIATVSLTQGTTDKSAVALRGGNAEHRRYHRAGGGAGLRQRAGSDADRGI